MFNVINMSKAGIAAIVFAFALTGCGGGDSSTAGSQASGGSDSSQDPVSSQGSGDDNGEAVDRTAGLSWTAPLQRQNDESLSMAELTGYVINYGQDPENLDQSVQVNDAYTMEYTIEDLSDGTWFFTIQAEDDSGLVSPPSDPVTKTIQS